ncbi:MAG: hypothetical protein IKZ82_02070 [Clostridia bacterium]|nr:hypothetical protein [Clostridia bacterium]
MELSQVAEILEAKVLTGSEFLDKEAHSACGSDMMSDVLAFVKDQGILLTGLVNSQVIRTTLMMDMGCVVFVRGKTPTEEMIALAENIGTVLMTTQLTMYESCGRLYLAGFGR